MKSKRIYTKEQKEAKKVYRELNNERIKLYQKAYKKERRATDPIFKISSLIRTSIGEAFRLNGYGKKTKTNTILGCSFDELKQHLESQFLPWMNWDNHGLYNGELNHGWDIDHIEPLSNAKTEDDIIRLNHYTNLRPLCSQTNRYIKRNN